MFLQIWHRPLWGNPILKRAAQSLPWTRLSGNGQSPVALTAATSVCTCCRVPVDHPKPRSYSISHVVLQRSALEISQEHSMKWPLHTNTCIYHSSVQVSLKLQGGLRCWCPSACQNVFLLNLLRNSSVHSDSFANSVYFHEGWLLPLCSSYERKQAWQEGYKLLQYQTPQYRVFLHAPEEKERTMRRQWKAENFVVAVPTLDFYKFTCTHWA